MDSSRPSDGSAFVCLDQHGETSGADTRVHQEESFSEVASVDAVVRVLTGVLAVLFHALRVMGRMCCKQAGRVTLGLHQTLIVIEEAFAR